MERIDGNLAALRDHMRKQDAADAQQERIDAVTAERQADPEYQIDALATVVDDYIHLVRDLVYGTQEQIDEAKAELRKLSDSHIADEVERDASMNTLFDDEPGEY